MRTPMTTLLIAVLLVAGAGFALADEPKEPKKPKKPEQIDNPEYLNWKKFKVGTWVKVENVTKMAASETKMVTTTTLTKLTADKAEVSSQMTMYVAGQEIKQPAQKREIPAKVPKVEMPKDGEKPDVKMETGEETLTVDGKKVACKWVKTTMAVGGNTTVSKVWNSDAVPGSMVKMESSTKGAMKVTTALQVTKFETK